MYEQSPGRKSTLWFIYALLALSCLAIIVKLFTLQIFATEYYRKASIDNSVRIVPIKAPRGDIIDRYGRLIVQNRASYTVYLVPYEVPDINIASAKLASMLGMDTKYLKEVISSGWKGRYQPIRLKRDVDFKTLSVLEEHSLDVPGLVFQIEPTRLYPDSGLGSHLYGYIGEVSESEIAADKDYSKGDLNGKKGLERYYDKYLRGRDGITYLEVTAKGRILGNYPQRENVSPIKGATLELNIDWELQQQAERLLALQGQGAIVALDVQDGGVLAIASTPLYDANMFSGVITSDEWAKIMADSTYPLLNRAIQGTYPPGSTFKAFTAAMGLHYDKVKNESAFDSCRGQKRFGNRTFKCWKPAGHGHLDLHGAIVQSCDVYFYQLGVACGIENFGEFMTDCHFGQLTGIDMPGEKAGLCPTSEYLNQRYGPRGWTKFVMVNLAIGQGEILVTPLQLAVLYAALANGGNIYEPHVVKKVIGGEGLDLTVKPEVLDTLPITNMQRVEIVDALTGVVDEAHGTASWIKIPGISIAGKTGTAQNPHGDNHAWFVCFAPADDPEIVVAVLVENAGHGSSIAAPIARDVLKFYFGDRTPVIPVEEPL